MKIDDAKQLALELIKDYEVAILNAYHLYGSAEDIKTKMQLNVARIEDYKSNKRVSKRSTCFGLFQS